MIYRADFDVKGKWTQQLDLPANLDRAAGLIQNAVRKRGVLMSSEIDVELEMAESMTEGKALVLVGGFRVVGRVNLTLVKGARCKKERGAA